MGFLRSIGPLEWVIILVIVLLIVGPKRLPELARGLGKGLRGFKEEVKSDDKDKGKEVDEDKDDDAKKAE
ncbi:MAG: twin-arginine translocase TatA/TatE family subunit [Bacillota bacterium]